MVDKEVKPVAPVVSKSEVVKEVGPVIKIVKKVEPAIPVLPPPEEVLCAKLPLVVELPKAQLDVLQKKALWFDLQQIYNRNANENQAISQRIIQLQSEVAKMQGGR